MTKNISHFGSEYKWLPFPVDTFERLKVTEEMTKINMKQMSRF